MNNEPVIIFFDGVCNLCNASVQYVLKRDKKNIFHFAALQSDFTKNFFHQKQFVPKTDSIVLYYNNTFYTESTAALYIAKQLRFPANIWYIFIVIPTPIRNAVYKLIASVRYKWFGRRDSCMMPSKDTANKFLDT
ncbi:MAG TPA: DCC1-like thiol-disulfide oxidoreductase family protein [Chitinophagales bacterium]|nr:DCC1-like thiol-disulfide oxidoreductase family protein [Chitinophagales bacterium]